MYVCVFIYLVLCRVVWCVLVCKVDMLVGDIYGRGYSKFQLSSNTLASSFGKVGGMEAPGAPGSGVGEEDLARSLLVMITMNIGQVSRCFVAIRRLIL